MIDNQKLIWALHNQQTTQYVELSASITRAL